MPDRRQKEACRKPAKSAARKPAKARREPARALGALPEWNLADLYPAIDAPEVKRDLDRADADCVAFEEAYKGKLADARGRRGCGREARRGVKRYEALDDLLGRLDLVRGPGLCRQHHRSGARANSTATCRSASPRPRCICLFFTLELNRVDDAALEAAMARSGARPLPAVDRGRAQGKAVSARGPHRGAVPREVA